jgi:RHS repeat-associated protein
VYDNAGRLDQITGPGLDGGYVEYTYLSNAPGLIASRTVYDSGDAAVTTTTHTYEAGRNNVTSVLNKSGSTTVSDYTYAYNDVNQRTHNGKSGTAFGTATHVAYTYDALRQVTEAERFTGVDFDNPGTAIPAQTFGYAYDTIGNRLTSRLGTIGTPIEETDYTTNALNQYTEIAHLPSSSSQLPIFDADGNLIEQDGWVYKWDAENRLIEAKVKTPSTSADRRLTFVYDAEGRRVEKRIFEWSGTVWLPIRRHTFVWAGWSMLLEHIDDEVASTDETIAYLWGLDLAGSTDATGNVGALLAIETDSVQGVYFYDANGNVGQVIDVTDGSLIASYEYSPFGEVISSSGSFAETNRFRFSTKYQDAETGWLYYGFRYYDPETGRWLNRDPIEEAGGLNLYGFVGNDGVNRIDRLGLEDSSSSEICCYFSEIFTMIHNVGREAYRIEAEEYGDYADPFGGDYRHCIAGCILVRAYGLKLAACALLYWDSSETDPDDSAAGWSGYRGALRHPFSSCRTLCKDRTVRPIGIRTRFEVK